MQSESPELLPPCCVSTQHCLPANTTLVFMGDSTTRYQYLDLVFTLRFRSRRHEALPSSNPLDEHTWPSWTAFYHGTNDALQPHERVCDCYRRDRRWVGDAKNFTCENRLFDLRECGVRVAYFQVFGSIHPIVGHWPVRDAPPSHSMWEWRMRPLVDRVQWMQRLGSMWQHDWPEALRLIVGPFVRPTVLILNAGLHPTDGLDYGEIRAAAVAATEGCVVWKTTTGRSGAARRLSSADEARRAFAGDVIFEAGALASRACGTRASCFNGIHFTPRSAVNHALNVGMIDRLREASCLLHVGAGRHRGGAAGARGGLGRGA